MGMALPLIRVIGLVIIARQASLMVITYKKLLNAKVDKLFLYKQKRGIPEDLYTISIMNGGTLARS